MRQRWLRSVRWRGALVLAGVSLLAVTALRLGAPPEGVGAAVFVLLFAAYWRWTAPLHAVLTRARRIAGESEASGDEWSELDRALSEIAGSLETSRRKQARRKMDLTAILEAMADPLAAVDREGRLLFWNRGFERELLKPAGLPGRKPGGERTRLIEILRHPAVHQAIEESVSAAAAPDLAARVPFELAPGKQVVLTVAPLVQRATPQRTPGGKAEAVGAVLIFHDVSDAVRAEKMQAEFVASVSHELRTPLTSIKGYAQFLADELSTAPLDAELRALVEPATDTMVRNVDRMAGLVSDLLDLAVLRSGRPLKREKIDAVQLARDVVIRLRPAWQAKKDEVSVEASEDGAIELVGDLDRLEQVLTNLVDNAIHHGPEGVHIQIHVSAGPTGTVTWKVTDNGWGIPAEHLPRLFDRFYRVGGNPASRRGTGLGLAIAKEIVDAHGGQISVTSGVSTTKKGAETARPGTCFQVTVPAQ